MILIVFIAAGLLVGWATGGSLSRLSQVKFRGEWLAITALLVQSALRGPLGEGIPVLARVVLWGVLTATALAVSCANWRLFGMPVVALGLALNLVVVIANSGMPVSPSAVSVLSNGSIGGVERTAGGFYHAASTETHLLLLADILPIPGPRSVRTVLSVGDVALLLGVSMVLARGMRASSEAHEPEPRKAPPMA